MLSSLRAAVTAVFLFSGAFPLYGQVPPAASVARTRSGVWQDVAESAVQAALSAAGRRPRRDIIPRFYRTLQLNKSELKKLLDSAPPESSGPIGMAGVEVEIPLPSGGFGRFLIQESAIMEPKLAARFPELKTYVGQSVDDPSTTIRLDLTPRGFHAIVLSAAGQIYIDPYSRDSDASYISYFKRDFAPSDKPFSCFVESQPAQNRTAMAAATTAARPTGGTLRTYRLALACTGEYAVSVCSPNTPTVAATLAAMITTVNRCSAIYERELSIRLLLVNNDDKLIYLDGTTDPYANSSPSVLLTQNQTNVDNIIGSANYDVGHVFSTGGGGLAYVGVVCAAGQKAKAETGTSNPVGDPYDVDYVAHEMGHQFGANHPFNGTSGSCSGSNRNASTAYEPGSGVTIMAYAGICSPQDLAGHSDDYFHTINYDEIDAYTSGGGASCAQAMATGNNPPTIAALTSQTIPVQTPFALMASATDPDGDTLTYCWEEFDLGPAQDPTADPRDNGSSPIFRSFPPTTNPTRTFPSLNYVLNYANIPPVTIGGYASGEYLPTTNRTMTYRVTVRDNHPGSGGSNYASMTVTSTTSAGPFAITSPNSPATFAAGSQMNVTWNVANTSAAPVSCANVRITLSTDGGYTFPIVLANSVPNSGSAAVTIPNTANIATTQGRIKVEAVGNIFFDISHGNLTITSTQTAPSLNITAGITVVRGKPTPTVATIGTASDAQTGSLTVSVSNLPFGAHVTPGITNGTISLGATVDCALVTTLSSRIYPITLTVTDGQGSTTSGSVNLMVTPNPSPTLGAYPDISISPNSAVTSAPAAGAADANGNLRATPYSILPTTLPGGGTLSVNQSTGAVTVTTTSTSTFGITPVRVTVLDSCGASAVQIFNVNVNSNTPVLQSRAASAPTAESCTPGNGAIDPGETVTVNLPISNVGGSATTNLVATLQNSGGITPITTSQNYGAIASNGLTARAFQFTASGTCGGVVTATLQLQDGATNYGTITYNMSLGVITTTLSENFDGVTPPALPSGWTALVATGSMAPWSTNISSPDSAPNSVSATTVDTPSDNRLTSPAVSVPTGGAQLSFRHRWNLEDGYDGGILELSLNGGPFTDIVSAGGGFASGGYNGTISVNYNSPIAGAYAWTGTSNSSYTTTVVNLPSNASGQTAQFRWRLASDSGSSAPTAIWRIDTISLSSTSYTCSDCAPPARPTITNGPPPSTVTVGSPFSFSFTATGNPAPTFAVTGGTLPPGLTLSSKGVLSGTPSSAGNGSFPNITVTATNGIVPDAQQSFSITAVTRASSYLNSFGLTGTNAGFNFDYDGDGIVNLLEYALQLDPTTADTSDLPAVTARGYLTKSNKTVNYLSMTFTRSSVATDLTYTVQASSDLTTWVDLASSVGGGTTTGTGFVRETGSAPNFVVEVKDSVAIDGTPGVERFIRLKVTSP
ncbi:MAG: hypothetical protein QOH39_151 [Verrucomicrobiota bacterium]|jgi:hypothetical protein